MQNTLEIQTVNRISAMPQPSADGQFYWYVESNHELTPCALLDASAFRRRISLTTLEGTSKTLDVHPEGVAHGRLFPRLYSTRTAQKPSIFVCHHRTLMHYQPDSKSGSWQSAVPHRNEHYRFQPFIADVIDSIHQRQNILLTGGTGVGKTTHITQLANRIGQPMLRVNFNGETRMSDLIGKVHVSNGATHWMDGILPMAMRHGWWLLLDELDFAEPAVLSLLHPVLEEESMLVLKENNGEIITPHPNFRLFATANSIGAMSDRSASYHGTQPMNEAFLDRWQVLFVDNLPLKDEVQVLRQAAPGLKPAWAKRIAQFAAQARQPSNRSFEYSGDNFSTRKSIAWAKKAALHRNPLKGAQLSWLEKLPPTEQEPLKQAIKTFFGTRNVMTKTSSASPGKTKTKSLKLTKVRKLKV